MRRVVLGCLAASWMAVGAPAILSVAQEVQFEKRCLVVSPNEGCDVGDIDRDGDLDIIAGSLWFAAPEWTPRPVRDIEEFDNDFYKNNGDHLWDVDGDGWLDVVTAHWHDSAFSWFKNPGEEGLKKGLKWEQNILADTRGQNEILTFVDLDDDDIPEIYVSCWVLGDPQVCWKMVEDADGQPTLERRVIGENGGGHGFAFGDVNGDGLDDVLTEAGYYERPAGDPWAGPWKSHPETALPHPSCPFLVVDLNEDGRNDILWGKAHDFGLFWWEQGEPEADGTSTWTEHEIDATWSQAHSLAWVDLDNDGANELVTGKRVRGHGGGDPGGRDPECLFYYEWDRETETFSRHVIGDFGEGIGAGMQIRVVDLNEDARLDIAVAGKTGTWVLINQGVK